MKARNRKQELVYVRVSQDGKVIAKCKTVLEAFARFRLSRRFSQVVGQDSILYMGADRQWYRLDEVWMDAESE